MAQVFVSYSRDIATVAKAIVADLESLGHDVWFDQALSGGQAWWAQILQRIREADAVVFLAAPSSLESTACRSEWQYALACRRTVVPVLVAEGVSMNLLPPALAALQVVDHRSHDRTAALRLARALTSVPTASPLPDPLPAAPSAPMSYLGDIAARIDAAEPLSFEAQSSMLVELRPGLKDPALRDDTRVVLQKLRRRRDAFASVAQEIDDALARDGSAEPPRSFPEPASPPPLDAPAVVPDSATPSVPVAVVGRAKMAALCGLLPLVVAGVLAEAAGPHTLDDYSMAAVIGLVGCAVAGAMVGYSWRSLWQIYASALVGGLLWAMLNPLGDRGMELMYPVIAFGFPAGALLMAAQLLWYRHQRRASAAGAAAGRA